MKSWKQNSTKVQLHSHLSPISKDEQVILDTAGEARSKSQVTFFYGLLHLDELVLTHKQELIYISSMRTQNVAK